MKELDLPKQMIGLRSQGSDSFLITNFLKDTELGRIADAADWLGILPIAVIVAQSPSHDGESPWVLPRQLFKSGVMQREGLPIIDHYSLPNVDLAPRSAAKSKNHQQEASPQNRMQLLVNFLTENGMEPVKTEGQGNDWPVFPDFGIYSPEPANRQKTWTEGRLYLPVVVGPTLLKAPESNISLSPAFTSANLARASKAGLGPLSELVLEEIKRRDPSNRVASAADTVM